MGSNSIHIDSKSLEFQLNHHIHKNESGFLPQESRKSADHSHDPSHDHSHDHSHDKCMSKYMYYHSQLWNHVKLWNLFSKNFEEKLSDNFYCMASFDLWNNYWFITVVCIPDSEKLEINFWYIFLNMFYWNLQFVNKILKNKFWKMIFAFMAYNAWLMLT